MDLNNLTPEQVEAIKSSGGFSGSLSGGIHYGQEPTSRTPQTSIPISGYGTNLRPRVEGNDTLVTSINIDKYNQADANRRLKEAEAAEAARKRREELKEFTNPEALQKRISYLERTVKRLEKALKEVTTNDR